MARLVEFELKEGGSVYVEVPEPEEAGMVPATRPGEVPEKAKEKFEEALDKVRPIVDTLFNKIKELAESPDKVEVEFGVKMNAEFGAVVASAGLGTHYTVTLTWETERAKEG